MRGPGVLWHQPWTRPPTLQGGALMQGVAPLFLSSCLKTQAGKTRAGNAGTLLRASPCQGLRIEFWRASHVTGTWAPVQRFFAASALGRVPRHESWLVQNRNEPPWGLPAAEPVLPEASVPPLLRMPAEPGEARIRILRSWLGDASTNPFCREPESNSSAAVGMGSERRGYESELKKNTAKLSRRKRLKPGLARQSFGRVWDIVEAERA